MENIDVIVAAIKVGIFIVRKANVLSSTFLDLVNEGVDFIGKKYGS